MISHNFNKINPNFCANIHSPKLNFSPKDFYVNIQGYGKNEEWANIIIKTADLGANLIHRNTSGENILKIITAGVKRANKTELSIEKNLFSGILRIPREGWAYDIVDIITPYDIPRYKNYAKRLNKIKKTPLTAPQANLALTKPHGKYPDLIHGDPLYINQSLDYTFKLFQKLFPKYLKQDAKPENLEEINSTIAEIRWILAHATPWKRGSDAIANVFTRVMYKALGIKTYPLKKKVSLDFEAYCTPLNEYKQKFATYFEKPPEIV